MKGEVINLLKVLYVPSLDINLLSGTTLYIYNRKGRLVLKAIKQGGLYIVNRIVKRLKHSTFLTAASPNADYRTTSVVRQSPETIA